MSGSVADRVVPTSRRTDGTPGGLRADFATGVYDEVVRARPKVAFICAAMTNMSACRDQPELSRTVNVTAPVDLSARLIDRGTFVIFLSSNTVFDGMTPWPDEDQPHKPANLYGAQKAEAESRLQAISGADRLLAVVRLSKVLLAGAGLPAEFLRRLAAGAPCEPFDDLLLSPASVQYVVEGLKILAEKQQPGIFHLSGAQEISYATLASGIADRFGFAAGLVQPTSSAKLGSGVVFRPRHPGLGMRLTRERLGIAPESLGAFWNQFCTDVPDSRKPVIGAA